MVLKYLSDKKKVCSISQAALDNSCPILTSLLLHHVALHQSPEDPRPQKVDNPLQYLVQLMSFCLDAADRLMQEVQLQNIDQRVSCSYG